MIRGIPLNSRVTRLLWSRFRQTETAREQTRSYVTIPEDLKPAFGFCVQQVRQYDYLNYVWVAQAHKDLRPALFALRAFNIETALVAESVRSREAVVGQIRFQWWRDAVQAAFDGRPPNHPVALALAHVLQQNNGNHSTNNNSDQHQNRNERTAVAAASSTASSCSSNSSGGDEGEASGAQCGSGCSTSAGPAHGGGDVAGYGGGGTLRPSRYNRYSFKRIIDCREGDFLDPQPPLDLPALEQYAEGTASQLMYLQLAAAGIKHQDADHAASHLGRAAGITTLLRGTASHAAARRCYLPVDLCAEARVSQEDVYDSLVSEGLRDVVHKVASLAKGHLDEARRLAPRLPPGTAAVMLPAVAVGRYLAALEAANFNPYDAKLIREHGGGGSGSATLPYVLAVKWHQLRGTY